MNRAEELKKIICKDGEDIEIKAGQLIDEIVFLEKQLIELKKLPFININPKNPMQQKATPASRMYKEFLQQYNNSLKTLFGLAGNIGDSEEESPLRKWVRSRKDLD